MTMPIEQLPFPAEALFGIGTSFLPVPVVQQVLAAWIRQVDRLYPRLRDRLREANGKTFLLMISDMPFDVLLRIEDGRMAGKLLPKQHAVAGDVTIRAASAKLLALLDGTEDGDALFFTRQLEVEGDTEALLVLRNSLDNEPIDIRRVAFSLFGPFSSVAMRASRPFTRLGSRVARDIQQLHRAVMAPVMRLQQEQARRLEEMERRLARAETLLARKSARNPGHG